MKVNVLKTFRYMLDGKEVEVNPGETPDLSESVARWAIRRRLAERLNAKVAPDNKAYTVTENKGSLYVEEFPEKKPRKKRSSVSAPDPQ